MSFVPQKSTHSRSRCGQGSISHQTTEARQTEQAGSQTASSSSSSAQLEAVANTYTCLRGTGFGHRINLFWDHWRLRRLDVQGRGVRAVEIEKDPERGGRSYGDAQDLESEEMHPSHLLISLP